MVLRKVLILLTVRSDSHHHSTIGDSWKDPTTPLLQAWKRVFGTVMHCYYVIIAIINVVIYSIINVTMYC
jgi:hypothetical protein